MFKGKCLARIAFSWALEEAAGCRQTVAFSLQFGTMDTTGAVTDIHFRGSCLEPSASPRPESPVLTDTGFPFLWSAMKTRRENNGIALLF